MEKNVRKFTLYAKEVKFEKQKFVACQAYINGKWYKIKFTKECEKQPKTKGLYEIEIDINTASFERGKRYIRNDGEYAVGTSTIWVNEIINIEKWTDEMYEKKNLEELSEVFDL